MSTSRIESIPASWDDERDVPFFTMTALAFPAAFAAGATVLLAANDIVEDVRELVLVGVLR